MDKLMKRVLDVVVAATLLLLLSPLLLIIAILVRLRLGSPIFFRQTRIGKDNQPFRLIKFRTMRNGDAPDDERLTPFGQWLRATSVDELPELWNILTGTMSLVGPRPLLPEYLPHYTPREQLRHTVPPGITGLAQINGRNALTWDARLELDAHYVENFTFIGDIDILWDTVAVVLQRKNISATGHATMQRFDVERANKGNP